MKHFNKEHAQDQLFRTRVNITALTNRIATAQLKIKKLRLLSKSLSIQLIIQLDHEINTIKKKST